MNRILQLRADYVTFKGIAELFNKEGLKTPYGKMFNAKHTWSIYKKGLRRMKRLEQEDEIKLALIKIQNSLLLEENRQVLSMLIIISDFVSANVMALMVSYLLIMRIKVLPLLNC